MASPSRVTAILFVMLVALVTAAFIDAVLKTARERQKPDRVGTLVLTLVVVGWLVVPAVLASRGALDRYNPLPAPGLLIVLLITVGTVGIAMSAFGARLASGLPLAALVGFQAFRIPVELLLHRLYAEGAVPVQMTYAGWNFDILSGITAAVLGLWLWSRNSSKSVVMAWNVMGLLLLANIVTIAVLSTPVPFRYFLNDPPNLLPSTFPYVWLPTFLVQAALFGHLLVFRRLAADRR